jgi:hypothetical protein
MPLSCQIPPIFNGERIVVYALLEADESVPSSATLHLETPEGPMDFIVRAVPADIYEGTVIHTLAARSLIHDLEVGCSFMHGAAAAAGAAVAAPAYGQIDAAIIQLACKYHLVSSRTSFVAVSQVGASVNTVCLVLLRLC